MHNPFIDSMSLLPDDRRATPYLPLPASYHGETAKYVKTDPVRVTPNAEPVAQKCTSCHNIGSRATCGDWLDRAVGWRYPTTASMLSREDPKIGKYMPDGHEFATKEAYYAAMGPHLDAMKCCCEHSDWSGCHTIDRSQPRSQGQAGTGERSCTNGTTGGWHQPCDGDNACNHSGLRCVSQRCVFRDEE